MIFQANMICTEKLMILANSTESYEKVMISYSDYHANHIIICYTYYIRVPFFASSPPNTCLIFTFFYKLKKYINRLIN